MTAQELAQLVAFMRYAQEAYFTARRRGAPGNDELRESKRLEREVDRAVADILSPQGDLLGGGS